MPDTTSLSQFDPIVGEVNATSRSFDAREFKGARKSAIVQKVRRACREHGSFYVNLDSEQQQTVNNTLSAMERFFAIADDDPRKQAIIQGPNESGWVPRFAEPAYQPGTPSRCRSNLPDTLVYRPCTNTTFKVFRKYGGYQYIPNVIHCNS